MDRLGLGSRLVLDREQCFWNSAGDLEGEGLLKARPHTNVRYSNEQSGPSEYYSSSRYRHPTMCDTVQVYQSSFKEMFSRFQLIKVSLMRIFEKAEYDVSDVLLCHLFFTA